MTPVGKVVLGLALALACLSIGFIAWGVHVGVTKRFVQGTGALGVLALLASVGIIALDQTYRWTRQALRELQDAEGP